MGEKVTLVRQLAALRGEEEAMERRLRRAVACGQMRQGEADYHAESFSAAIATLEWLLFNEAVVRRVHERLQAGEEIET